MVCKLRDYLSKRLLEVLLLLTSSQSGFTSRLWIIILPLASLVAELTKTVRLVDNGLCETPQVKVDPRTNTHIRQCTTQLLQTHLMHKYIKFKTKI